MTHPRHEAWLVSLTHAGPRALSLDEIGDAIGDAAITPAQIEDLFQALEAKGCTIGLPAVATGGDSALASDALRRVLPAARALRQELGRPPSPSELAQRCGTSLSEVRRALLFAQVLQR